MELTKDKTIELCIEMWEWLAETGGEKEDWPELDKYGYIESYCFFCEYATQQHGGFKTGDCKECLLVIELGEKCHALGYSAWNITFNKNVRREYAAKFLANIKKCQQKLKENKMSKTITISDETFKALKEQIEKLETKKLYPIATVNDLGRCQRLILNLPDEVLTKNYKGKLIAIDRDGELATTCQKDRKYGTFYDSGENKQVFPIKE